MLAVAPDAAEALFRVVDAAYAANASIVDDKAARAAVTEVTAE